MTHPPIKPSTLQKPVSFLTFLSRNKRPTPFTKNMRPQFFVLARTTSFSRVYDTQARDDIRAITNVRTTSGKKLINRPVPCEYEDENVNSSDYSEAVPGSLLWGASYWITSFFFLRECLRNSLLLASFVCGSNQPSPTTPYPLIGKRPTSLCLLHGRWDSTGKFRARANYCANVEASPTGSRW